MIVKLTLEDALAVAKDMREEDAHGIRAMLGGANPEIFAVHRWQTTGPAWSLYQDDEPVAIFGLAEQAAWAVCAWLVAKPSMRPESWRKLLRHTRIVHGNLPGSQYRRVEALVLEDWPAAIRFAERLGFRHEGTKRRAGRDGEDFRIYAMTDF